MPFVPSLFGRPREWALDLAVATAVGVFLGVIGPFGSYYGGSLGPRIAYWIANLWIGFIVLSLVTRLAIRLAIRWDVPVWFAVAVGVAVGAAPLSALMAPFAALVWPGNHGRVANLFVIYSQILALGEPCAFAYYFLADRGWRAAVAQARAAGARLPEAGPPEAPTPALPAAGFLDRLPPRLGRELLCLQMEDHYVRAYTPRGSDLILTPLKDAIAELNAADGLQVHRSWWVARAAVAEPVVRGRSVALRLTNGVEAPVSRAQVARLRAAGWLGGAE